MTIETIIQDLRNIVDEWQEACEGENLEDVKASVKLILGDVCFPLSAEIEKIDLKIKGAPRV